MGSAHTKITDEIELDINGEFVLSRQYVEGVNLITSGTRTDAQHVRVVAEGSHERKLTNGSMVTPTVSLGMRTDGWNHQSFLGVEVGGGIECIEPRSMSISGLGQFLIVESNRIGEWEMSGTLEYDSNRDEQGVILSINPEWSQATSEISPPFGTEAP